MKMKASKRALDKIYKRRNRYEIPDWQRGKVWDRQKKQNLIDTILRGWKLPKFYFLRDPSANEEFEVVDGQQRMTAIFEFFDNQLPLSRESAERFGGEYYRDLPGTVSDNFDDFEIDYDEIEEASDEELKLFFQRLQDGLPLTSSEKLNSVHSNLRDFARNLSSHSFFTSRLSISDTRFAYFDIATKVAAIEINGIGTGLRYDDMKRLFEDNATFSTKSSAAQRLSNTLDYLTTVFPLKSSLLKNRTIIQSLVTLASRIVAAGNGTGYEAKLLAFFENFSKELTAQVELGNAAIDRTTFCSSAR